MTAVNLTKFDHKEKFFDEQTGQFNPQRILLVGKSGCGKSFIMRDILASFSSVMQMGIVVSGTESDGKPFYSQFIPRMFMFSCQDVEQPGFFKTFISYQERRMERKGIDALEHIFIVMDDCVADTKWLQRPDVSKLLFEGRHLNITIIVAVQYDKLIPPKLRGNFSFLILPQTNNKKMLAQVNTEFVNADDKCFFDAAASIYSERFRCMIIDNDQRSSTQNTKKITWYKSEAYPELKLCHERYWKINQEYGNLGKKKRQRETNIVDIKKGEDVRFKIVDQKKVESKQKN